MQDGLDNLEMIRAFDLSYFEAIDFHMSCMGTIYQVRYDFVLDTRCSYTTTEDCVSRTDKDAKCLPYTILYSVDLV